MLFKGGAAGTQAGGIGASGGNGGDVMLLFIKAGIKFNDIFY
jgi:hypothetical protein